MDQAAHTTPWRGLEGGTPPLGVVGPWPPSGSPSVFVFCPGKIGGPGFVLSNSKNISCVAFLNTKIAKNRELSLWHLFNRLVPENA
jgi:hypothetical protein